MNTQINSHVNKYNQSTPNTEHVQISHIITRDIVDEYQVLKGYALAPVLGIHALVDNHESIRLWIQKQLDNQEVVISLVDVECPDTYEDIYLHFSCYFEVLLDNYFCA